MQGGAPGLHGPRGDWVGGGCGAHGGEWSRWESGKDSLRIRGLEDRAGGDEDREAADGVLGSDSLGVWLVGAGLVEAGGHRN